MDGRAVAAFVLALDDADIPTDPRQRFKLIAWFTWATAMLNYRWTTPEEVPSDIPLPVGIWTGPKAGSARIRVDTASELVPACDRGL
jgi:hemoglobin